MEKFESKQVLIFLTLGLIGWALCGAIMFVGMAVTSMQTTLIVHALGAPVIFATISWIYFTRWKFTSPFVTALLFTLIVVFMDFFLVALVINRSLEMFQSLLGVWIPLTLIFLSTYLTGLAVEAGSRRPQTV